MTLGQFREITETYGDDCILTIQDGGAGYPVCSISITIEAATPGEEKPTPIIKIL